MEDKTGKMTSEIAGKMAILEHLGSQKIHQNTKQPTKPPKNQKHGLDELPEQSQQEQEHKKQQQ